MTFEQIIAIYKGSDADATKALYAKLMQLGARGVVAVNLLRACKASERAKKYRGKPSCGGASYRSMGHDKKDWSIGQLCDALVANPDVVTSWGWGRDSKALGFEDVLYVDIPGIGQVSFHNAARRAGPNYPGQWDKMIQQAPRRICLWAEAILAGREVQQAEHNATRQEASLIEREPRIGNGHEQAGFDL